MPTIHTIKAWPEPFQAMWDGNKTFEFRKNDRDFGLDDVLIITEYDTEYGVLTGRVIEAKVVYILIGPAFGVPEGFCVMSTRIRIKKNPYRLIEWAE